MTATIGPLPSRGQESSLTDRTFVQAQSHAAPGPVAAPVAAMVESPPDKVELKSNYIDDIRHLKAAGPGVPLFQSTEALEPTTAGRTVEPVQYNSSGKSLLVDAFG